jgi:hypothetical protein
METSIWFGAIPLMGLMTMTSMMTKSCSPAMTVVTIRFENRIPVAHSVVPNSSMMMMMMTMITKNLRHVAGTHQAVVLVVRPVVHLVVLVVRPVVHLVVLEAARLVEVLAVAALPAEVLAVVLPVEVLAVAAHPAEVLAVALLVEVPAVVLPVGVLAVVPQAVVKVALPSERALLGD